jgi:hypothetical protein
VHTQATTAWPPTEPLPRPRIKGAGGELSALMRGMMNAQANDSGWPTFSGKYVRVPSIPQGVVGIPADVSRACA